MPRRLLRLPSNRRRPDAVLGSRPNVWATGYGAKVVDGVAQPGLAYVVFVTQKRARRRLRDDQVVPRFVTRGRHRLRTDVQELRPLRLEASPAADVARVAASVPLTDGRRLGTLSAFAVASARTVGLSCAHVLLGRDADPTTNDPIRAYERGSATWQDAGTSYRMIYQAGDGVPEAFGRVDAGVFIVENARLAGLSRRCPPLPLFRPEPGRLLDLPTQLQGKEVWGVGARSGLRRGRVAAVWWQAIDEPLRFDVLIMEPGGGPLTQPGDSGMVWRLDDGRALAMHVMGEDRGPEPSPSSASCFLYRPAALLGISNITAFAG